MRYTFYLLAVASLSIAAHAQAQTLLPGQLGVGGQGMGGQPINLGGLGQGMNFGSFGQGMNNSGFVPGGQNMGGQPLSLNQYMAARMLMGLGGGRSGVHTGSPYPFANGGPQYPQSNQPMMSLPQPKSSKASATRLSPEERKANAKALAENRRAKVAAAAAERKAKAAEKSARQQAAATSKK
jgi:hypothetical protein